MITEDYVSFETAKLLKEKGFACATNRYYNAQYDQIRTVSDLFMMNFNNEPYMKSLGMAGAISIPTLQMALKWLREVHHLCIFLIPSYVDENFHNGFALYPVCNGEWEWCASKNDGSKATFGYNVNNKYCETYEEAANAAILYALKNLIEL